MKKQIDQIIKEIPELKKDKKKLGNILWVLKKIQPQNIPRTAFKKQLKKRLSGMIDMRSSEKKSFLLYLIPAMSFAFVFTGLYFVIWDGQYSKDSVDTRYKSSPIIQADIVSLKEQPELQEIELSLDNTVHLEESENIEPKVKKTIVPEVRDIEKSNQSVSSIQQETEQDNINPFSWDTEIIPQEIIPQKIEPQIRKISQDQGAINSKILPRENQNNELIELFGESVDSDIQDTEGSAQGSFFDELSDEESFGGEEMMQDEFIEFKQVGDFESFCSSGSWSLSQTGSLCTYENKKTCKQEEFIENKCSHITK